MKSNSLANIFPMMNEKEFKELKEDIKNYGLIYSIVTIKNEILDGRNRYKACKELKIEPKFKEYKGKDALQFIISTNLKRRHLNESQRAIVGENITRQLAVSFKDASKMMNVGLRSIERASEIKRKKPEEIMHIESGKKRLGAVIREIQEDEADVKRRKDKAKADKIKSPEELFKKIKFTTIVIDPPWDWNDEGDINQMGRAKPKYATISFDELKKLPIPKITEKNSHIYLCVTNRSLPKGFELLKEWGYRYITCITWCKPSFGMGNYFRGSTEQILFGVKGSLPLKKKNVGTWFQAKRGKGGHSSKPDELYTLVETCSPGLYLDYFGRKKRKGWYVYGN